MNLPSEFDPSANLIAHQEENGLFHSAHTSAALAESLMRDSSWVDVSTVEKIIVAVLDCQITDEDDPHFGNFLWEKESEVVEDLNAVEFMMFRFIPLLWEGGRDRRGVEMGEWYLAPGGGRPRCAGRASER
mgnify:CR=1 FL=1